MSNLLARDVMTIPAITIHQDITLKEAAETLMENHISGAPVVDDAGTLVGIISESDLLNDSKRRIKLPRAAVFGFVIPTDESLMKAFENGMSLRAKEVMTRKVVFAEEDTPVKVVSHMLLDKCINRVPVVRDGKPVGIITRSDLLKALMG